MIGEIGHLGEASPKKGLIASFLFTLAATTSAALLGFGFGAAGLLIRWLLGLQSGPLSGAAVLPIAALALVGGLIDLGFVPWRLPQPARQVNRALREAFGPSIAAARWGFRIGFGFTTYSRSQKC